ncbi:MAG: enoyl-CoA hydratase-related protein [Gammaproteobacteria bacterium]|nr:enoyl-CoA hydratase-related protein [Gammaproteobacteria bacterium]
MSYETILLERKQSVGLITLNRPEVMNALCEALFNELADAIDELESDNSVAAIVITGNDRAFAAGADIVEMKDKTYADMLADSGLTKHCDRIAQCRKPVIAAVAGYALGGGCEVAMMCDFIIAAENAKFGQPEITIGTVPGIGGSQRLTRLVGKSKAMDMCLTGRMMDAAEAERSGLVSRVESIENYLQVALDAAAQIAGYSRPVVTMLKELVNTSLETPLEQGLKAERAQFKASFALDDQKEGMTAFAEKRKPDFKNQ